MSQPHSLKASLPGLGRIIRRFWPQIRKQRSLLVVSLLTLLAEIGLRLLEPWPLKFIFDHIIGVKPGGNVSSSSVVPAASALSGAVASAGKVPGNAEMVTPLLIIQEGIVQIGLQLLPWPLKAIFSLVNLFRVVKLTPTFTLWPNETRSAVAPWWQGLMTSLERLQPVELLTLAALSVVLIISLRAGATYLNTISLALAGNRVLTEVRGDLYRHLQRLSLSYHTKAKSGDLITRIMSDIGRMQEITVTAVLPLLTNFLTLVGMIGLMFWLNWELALVALAAFPLFSLSMIRLTGRIQSVAREQRQREGAMAAAAVESISAIKVVQALSLETTLDSAFSKQNKKNLTEGVKSKRLAAGLERTVDIMIAIGTALVLWYGARLVLRGALTAGDLLVFMAYLKNAFKPMQDLAKYTGRIAQASASSERVLDILNTTPDIRDRPEAIAARPFRGGVRFENVSFAYETGHPTLKDINFEVHPGQHIALVGSSGSGKSTLVSLLLRLYDPTQGSILIDGHDIRDYKLATLRPQIGIVLQDSILFAVSVRDNIAYGWLDARDEEIEAAARLANAHHFIAALPQGYNTCLGERGATLSGGERQRIAIARTAVRRAPIIILDEPTTGLDRENERAVSEALDRLAQGRTTFLIAHDLHTVEQADLILYLEAGRIIERGSHAQLMRRGGHYAAMYALQSATRHNHAQSNSRVHEEVSHVLTR